MTNSCPDTMNEWVKLGRDFNISPEVALALEDTIKNGYTYYTGVIDNLGHYVSKTKKCGCSRFYKLVIDMDTGQLTKVPKQRLRKDKYGRPHTDATWDKFYLERIHKFLLREGLF